MSYYHHKKSKTTGTLWLAMAVFFTVFCSSPVKRYVRLHLYNPKAFNTNTAGDHFSTHDIKDCLIAEKHEQAEMGNFSFLHVPANDFFHSDFSFSSSFTPELELAFFRKDEVRYATSLPGRIVMPTPVYLWVRHLQV
jgi:hypothetical protein